MADMNLDRLVRDAIERAYAKGQTGDSIRDLANREVDAALRRRSAGVATEREVRQAMTSAFKERDAMVARQFNSNRTPSPEQLAQIDKDTQAVAERAETATRGTSRKTLSIVSDAIRRYSRTGTEQDWRRVAERAARKVGALEQHVRTEIETAKAAMDTALRIRQAVQAGYVLFRYSGPIGANSRTWCRDHLNMIYTLDEIRRMDNGQGLVVLLYRGGYNCHHRWTPEEDTRDKDRKKLATSIDDLLGDDFRDVVGAPISGERMAEAFDVRIPGVRMKAVSANARRSSATISMEIRDTDGKYRGTMQRSFVQGKAALEVSHDYFELDTQYQGRGGASNMMANSLAMYDELGVETVRVHAALDGGHLVWAKLGFEFDDVARPNQRREWAFEFGKHIIKGLGLTMADATSIIANLSQPQDFVNYDRVVSGVRVSGAEWKAGRSDMHWWGKLDVSGPGRERIERYIARKKSS